MRLTARDREERRCPDDRDSVQWMNARRKSGSRDTDGNVPNVNWNPDNRTVNVNWNGLDDSNRNGGVRRAVSTRKSRYRAGFCVRYRIQPLVILDVSTRRAAILM